MSVRFGISYATPLSASGKPVGRLAPIRDAEHRGEVLEQVGAVVRARARPRGGAAR